MAAVARLHQDALPEPRPREIGRALLSWYDQARRELPWRAGPGEAVDPYRVWLSEIMLQQTTVKAVVPYYRTFLKLWPTVEALAGAHRDEIMRAWAGLGYYSRARNLHECAKAVVAHHGGAFPRDLEALRALPGIGPYTAAAIAAIAFGTRAMPVDGNVERVVSRLFAIDTPFPAAKAEVKALAEGLAQRDRSGDFAQAMMDLGATVCTPRRPSCMICPIAGECRANALGLAAELPRRTPKGDRPVRYGIAFLALGEAGDVLLRRRPEDGLLAGMMEVPSTEWGEEWIAADEALRLAPVRADWWPIIGSVSHTFTHFRLEMQVYRAVVPANAPLTLWADQSRCTWVARRDLARQALPSLMRKIIARALAE